MNRDELFSGRGNAAETSFSSIPTRVHNSYSAFKTPHFVNNGALKLSATNTHINLEDDANSFSNIGVEVRTLRKALNLPVDFLPNSNGLTSFSNHWLNQNGSRNSQVYLADSGYSSKTFPQSVEAMQNGTVSGYSSLGMESSNEVKNSTSCSSHDLNSWGKTPNSSSFYERSLKSSLDESETKRMLLLEKLREAHLTIQNQAEKLAEGESEICLLRGQLKSVGIEQEGLQQEVDCLTMEKKTLEFFKSESLKNREEFLVRVNDLDKALKVLTATHNALQTEAQKKGALLEKTTLYVTALQQDNDKLQEANSGLEKELSSLRNKSVDQQTSYKNDVSKQLEQLNKDYHKVLQEQAVVKHQLSESMKATEQARNNQEKLNQEIIKLRMERDIQCGKVIVLEEEIQHQQQSYNNLLKEQERVLKDKAEQDQRLQREIHDRLCLKMVNDLLKEESAHVKEAFQKLEEFTSSMEQKSKDASLLQQENPSHSIEEMVNGKSRNGDLLLKIASAKSHCDELESQLSSLQEANRILTMEKEDTERQLQLIKMREGVLTEQVWKSKELKNENESLKLSLDTLSKRNKELVKQVEYQKQELESLKKKLKDLSSSITESHQGGIHFLQEEVDKIKETVTRLESEKTELIFEVNKLHKEQEMWAVERSELKMTLAEVSAENTQLRDELRTKFVAKDPNDGTTDTNRKLDPEQEEAVKNTQEDLRESFDEVCLELKTVKSELSKVWGMLQVKEKQLEEQSLELQQEQEKSQKWAEELIRLRKNFADLTTKTSSRSQMICTLRDELMQRCQEIMELETALSSAKQLKCDTLKKSPLQMKDPELKRRRSDSDISKRLGQPTGNSRKESNEIKKVTALNTQLKQRMKDLMAERDSALQDAQDLLNGMQQLREAFEEEMERELERERTNFEREKQLLQKAKSKDDDEQPNGAKSKLETQVTLLTEEKLALEVKSKNLEYERDELRSQVEELCKMRTAAEEKAVQVDSVLSPRKRENNTTLRKRSKSVGMMPPYRTVQEIPDRIPGNKSGRKNSVTCMEKITTL